MATRASPPPPPPKPNKNYNKSSPELKQNAFDEHQQNIGNNNNNVENFYNQTNNNGNIINNNINNNNYESVPTNEQVVMTPRGKTSNSTIILIERKLVEEVSDRVHVAGGDHRGIIINKDTVKGKFISMKGSSKDHNLIKYLSQIKSPQKQYLNSH